MNRRRALAVLSCVVSFAAGAGWPRLVAAGAKQSCECEDKRDCDDPVTASTRRAEAGRHCDGRTFARVDNELDPPRLGGRKEHDHPFERVQARGEGKIKATGDKGAIRELRNKRRWVK